MTIAFGYNGKNFLCQDDDEIKGLSFCYPITETVDGSIYVYNKNGNKLRYCANAGDMYACTTNVDNSKIRCKPLWYLYSHIMFCHR